MLTGGPELQWDRLAAERQRIHGTITCSKINHADGARITFRSKHQIKQNAESWSFSEHVLEGSDPRIGIVVKNDRYAFRLQKQTSDAPWVLVEFLEAAPKLASVVVSGQIHIRGVCNKLINVTTPFNSLPIVVKDPDFRWTSFATESRPLGRLVRAEFSYRAKRTEPRHEQYVPAGWNEVERGWLLLDPEQSWVICEYGIDARYVDGSVGSIEGKFEYARGQDGIPTPIRCARRYLRTEGATSKLVNEIIDEYQVSREGESPLSDFTLGAFQIPEPPLASAATAPNRTYQWLLLGALLTFIAAVLLKVKATRIARTARGPT
jgi:hypothetical protein